MSILAEPPPATVYEPKTGIHYNTGKKLGNGGFAICYAAELRRHAGTKGEIVALKIVKHQKDRRIIQKFASELQLHSKLHHPNVVDFYRAFTFEENTYVVLELCHNGSLADALKQRRFFTMPEIRRFLIQLCGAVKYLHHRNIVHRDLKTGNILLDRNMNIKIADFGLAAVLVGPKDGVIRRTTMCGTPNYLAPEILEKQGHNDKADLWSIGIIVYTLAVGKAPFHSASKEEIYKKALAMKYDWPDITTHKNDISSDLRELVSDLLVYEEELRPGPDQIVSHPFFKLQFIPEVLDSSCTKTKPTWPVIKPPSASTIQRGYSDSWYRVCKASGVGEYAPGRVFPLNGAKRIVSVVRDCEKEVTAGRAPVVPIPKDIVYLPFPERQTPFDDGSKSNQLSAIGEEKESSSEGRHLADLTVNRKTQRPQAVTLRSIHQLNPRECRGTENVDPGTALPHEEPVLNKQLSSRRRRDDAKVVALSRNESTTVRTKAVGLRQTSRTDLPAAGRFEGGTTSTAKPALARRPSRRDILPTGRTTIKTRDEPIEVPGIESQPPVPLQTRAMELPAKRLGAIRKPSREQPPTIRSIPQAVSKPVPGLEVISISDDGSTSSSEADSTQYTNPAIVLARAAKLRDNLTAALVGKRGLPSKRKYTPQSLPFVAKWVDYARKHGVGWILEDGTIGCLFNATAKYPVTHAVCRSGYRHLQEVGESLEKAARVSMDYYTQGFSLDEQDLRNDSRQGLDPAGHELRKGGADSDHDRQRGLSILWVKFGRYMCQTLGEAQVQGQTVLDGNGDAVFPRLYQRLGTVGAWGFSDGSLQFNFPDHTKVVVSPDGAYINFTCLTIDAMAYLQAHGTLSYKHIRQRRVLSGSPMELLYGTSSSMKSGEHQKDLNIVPTTEANQLRDKLKFIALVVGQWVQAEGLGCSPEGKIQKMFWTGSTLDEGKKEDWTTVGRFGGDVKAS